jgi:hypothetical protein
MNNCLSFFFVHAILWIEDPCFSRVHSNLFSCLGLLGILVLFSFLSYITNIFRYVGRAMTLSMTHGSQLMDFGKIVFFCCLN